LTKLSDKAGMYVSNLVDKLITEYNQGNYKKALSIWIPWFLINHPYVCQARAGSLIGLGKYKKAERLLKKGIQQNPEDATLYSAYGYLMLETDRLEEAVAFCKKAVELDDQSYHANFGYAKALFQTNENELAFHHVKEAFYHAKEAYPMLCISNFYVSISEFDLAIEASTKALELKDDLDEDLQSRLYNNRAFILMMQNRDQEAVEFLNTALDLTEDDKIRYSIDINLGACLNNTGDYEQAVHHSILASHIKPESNRPYANLGDSYLLLQEDEKAVENYLLALQISENTEIKDWTDYFPLIKIERGLKTLGKTSGTDYELGAIEHRFMTPDFIDRVML